MENQEVNSASVEEGQPQESAASQPAVENPPVLDAAAPEQETGGGDAPAEVFTEELFVAGTTAAGEAGEAQLMAILEAVIYVTEEPLSAAQIAAALQQPVDRIERILEQLTAEYNRSEHGVTIREIAGGYKMATKAEHHEAIRAFVKNLKPPLKLSLAALETLSVIAYKQPITAPEIGEIRGVQGTGVLKTLIDRKLIAPSGRKAVVGKPILYKTTKEFLIQFGLKDLSELPTLKEFEEIGKFALGDPETETAATPVEEMAAATGPETPETSEHLDPAQVEPDQPESNQPEHAEPVAGSE